MMRFLIFLVLILSIYFYLRRLFTGGRRYDRFGGRRNNSPTQPPPPIIDELVQDPVCGAYCPKREAKSLVLHGKKYYFCSMECLHKFKEKNR